MKTVFDNIPDPVIWRSLIAPGGIGHFVKSKLHWPALVYSVLDVSDFTCGEKEIRMFPDSIGRLSLEKKVGQQKEKDQNYYFYSADIHNTLLETSERKLVG